MKCYTEYDLEYGWRIDVCDDGYESRYILGNYEPIAPNYSKQNKNEINPNFEERLYIILTEIENKYKISFPADAIMDYHNKLVNGEIDENTLANEYNKKYAE